MTISELKPCPFDGGEPELCKNLPVHQGGPLYWVLCKKCHACPGSFRNELDAIAAWNTRVTKQQHGDDVERVARAIANHFVERFGARLHDGPSETVELFSPIRFNVENVARAALDALRSKGE